MFREPTDWKSDHGQSLSNRCCGPLPRASGWTRSSCRCSKSTRRATACGSQRSRIRRSRVGCIEKVSNKMFNGGIVDVRCDQQCKHWPVCLGSVSAGESPDYTWKARRVDIRQCSAATCNWSSAERNGSQSLRREVFCQA